MTRWQTKDVATFEHNTNPNTTILGEVKCLLCDWVVEPTAPVVFPRVDDVVDEHMTSSHPEILNAAGVQRAPDDGLLVYYVILNP